MSASQIIEVLGPPVIDPEARYHLVDQKQRMLAYRNRGPAGWYDAFVVVYPENKDWRAIVWFPEDPMKKATPVNMEVDRGGGVIENYSLHAWKQEESSKTFWSREVRSEPKILVKSPGFDRDGRFSLFWDLQGEGLNLLGVRRGDNSDLTVSRNTRGLCNFNLARVR